MTRLCNQHETLIEVRPFYAETSCQNRKWNPKLSYEQEVENENIQINLRCYSDRFTIFYLHNKMLPSGHLAFMQRRINIMTLHRRKFDVAFTSCARLISKLLALQNSFGENVSEVGRANGLKLVLQVNEPSAPTTSRQRRINVDVALT